MDKDNNKKEEKNTKMSVWATTLKGIIKLNKKEKSIMPNAQIIVRVLKLKK